MACAEGARQQFIHPHHAARAIQCRQCNVHIRTCEFRDFLTAPSAWWHWVRTVSHDQNLGNHSVACSHHRGNRTRFGASPFGVGNVLDIAADIDRARGRAQRRPHLETGIRHIGVLAHFARGVIKGHALLPCLS